ncbi:MAG: biotin/lipoate A/B protein ligase family protein [Candidatus Woesearchaeota archaeon]
MKVRLLPVIEDSAARLMAIDEAILTARSEGKSGNTLRFYKWKPSAVTIGYFQNAEKEVNLDYLKKNGIDIVRRLTGGGAVYHKDELTYSVFLNDNDIEDGKDTLAVFKKICGAIIYGLKEIGIKAEFAPINDIVADGKKVSGNAQTRKGNAILQHGTILLSVDKEMMFKILTVDEDKVKLKNLIKAGERVTSLSDVAGKRIEFDEVRKSIVKGFEDQMDIKFVEGDLSEYEKELIDKFYKEKYNNDEWNMKR